MWGYLGEVLVPHHLRRRRGRQLRVLVYSIIIGAVVVGCVALLLYTLYHRTRI